MKIVLVSSEYQAFNDFVKYLDLNNNVSVLWVAGGQDALEYAKKIETDLVVVAEQLNDGLGLEFIKQLAKEFPLANSALISTLAAEEFHQQTEGLGVLMQLPVNPGEKEAIDLLNQMGAIRVLFTN